MLTTYLFDNPKNFLNNYIINILRHPNKFVTVKTNVKEKELYNLLN